jgi:hypothetical protein
MAIVIPTAWLGAQSGGLAATPPQPVRASHPQRLIEDVQRTYATRLRCLFSLGFPIATTAATFFDLMLQIPIRTSEGTAATGYTVQLIGSQIEVRVTVSNGVTTASATVTQSAAGTASATGVITTAPPVAGDADLFLKIEIRATSGTGNLLGVAIRERDLTTAEL